MTKVRGLRGATTADANTRDDILDATRELLERLVEANDVHTDDIAAVTFSATKDLDAEFPAVAARVSTWDGPTWPSCAATRWTSPADKKRCIRVLILGEHRQESERTRNGLSARRRKPPLTKRQNRLVRLQSNVGDTFEVLALSSPLGLKAGIQGWGERDEQSISSRMRHHLSN